MGKKKFASEDIPYEVWWVCYIQCGEQPVGINTYNKIQEIIDKYPKYFKWEHTYKSLPQEVHEAYLDEENPHRHEPVNYEVIGSFAGIKADISRECATPAYATTESRIAMFDNLIKELEEEGEAEERKIELWDKHYKKYKLEWRR